MPTNKRGTKRIELDREAWISLDRPATPIECRIVDISDSGAKIEIIDAQGFPETFDLFLTRNGSVRRRCKIAWQDADTMGLRFLDRAEPKREKCAPRRLPAAN